MSLGLRMEALKTLACLESASSVVEVRDRHHEVRLGHRIILVYNMSSVDIELLMSAKKMQWTF